MPVTFKPASHNANPVHLYAVTRDPFSLLQGSCREVSRKCSEMLQSSFSPSDFGPETVVYSNHNGFVNAAVSAYNNHHHLIIRPDDVWIAILAQFSIYVNEHAEELRHLFVAHEGKKELKVDTVGTRYTVDFGALANSMGHLIQENVIDPDLRKWIIPDFTTTTQNDQIVSSVVMMATLQKYFDYKIGILCGIPSVTLLGEKKDWEQLVGRLEKLRTFGKETTDWYNLLKPVLSRFVRAFDGPDTKENIDFWQTIAHYSGGGSGPTYLSGWITAFCYWEHEGKSLYAPRGVPPKDLIVRDGFGEETPRYTLDGVLYHRVDTDDIPGAYAEVPVLLDDNGTVLNTIMVAGVVGIRARRLTDSGANGPGEDSNKRVYDTLQPVVGWWIFEKK